MVIDRAGRGLPSSADWAEAVSPVVVAVEAARGAFAVVRRTVVGDPGGQRRGSAAVRVATPGTGDDDDDDRQRGGAARAGREAGRCRPRARATGRRGRAGHGGRDEARTGAAEGAWNTAVQGAWLRGRAPDRPRDMLSEGCAGRRLDGLAAAFAAMAPEPVHASPIPVHASPIPVHASPIPVHASPIEEMGRTAPVGPAMRAAPGPLGATLEQGRHRRQGRRLGPHGHRRVNLPRRPPARPGEPSPKCLARRHRLPQLLDEARQQQSAITHADRAKTRTAWHSRTKLRIILGPPPHTSMPMVAPPSPGSARRTRLAVDGLATRGSADAERSLALSGDSRPVTGCSAG